MSEIAWNTSYYDEHKKLFCMNDNNNVYKSATRQKKNNAKLLAWKEVKMWSLLDSRVCARVMNEI